MLYGCFQTHCETYMCYFTVDCTHHQEVNNSFFNIFLVNFLMKFLAKHVLRCENVLLNDIRDYTVE